MHRDPCLRQLFLESLLQDRELKAGTNSCWPGVLRSPGRQPRAGFGTVCPRPLLATPPPRAGPSTSLCPLGSPLPTPHPPPPHPSCFQLSDDESSLSLSLSSSIFSLPQPCP